MSITSTKDLYNVQKEIWKEENEKYFGITPLDSWNDLEVVAKHLEKCIDKFWNNGTNELKKLLERGRCRDYDKMIPNSWEFIFDNLNGCICLYAQFEHLVDDKLKGEMVKEVKRAPIAYLPYPNDLCWFLNHSEYVLRISASVNYSLITRKGNLCQYQRSWIYDIEKDEFDVQLESLDPFKDLTKINQIWLKSVYGKTIENEKEFREALKSLPEVIDPYSVINFKFGHVDSIFTLVSSSKRFANPLKRVPVPINVIKMFITQRRRDDEQDNGNFSNLVLSKSKLFALENCRTVIFKSKYNRGFSFTDSQKLFDAFKTSTSKSAGRSRLLLDTAIVKDDLLWNVANDGKLYNMYDLVLNDEIKVTKNISVVSHSRFCTSNGPKRLMMTAKLRAQAVQTAGETNEFTHETPARIVFGDYKGFNHGDAFIISRSFAKKMEAKYTKEIRFYNVSDYNALKSKYKVGDKMSVKDFSSIVKSNSCNNYRNITIDSLDKDYLKIHADAPFSVGDKMTNFHGSKGIVNLILDDEEMPYLKNDIVDKNGNVVFEKGPFEVICSGLSVYKRKTTGQLFEAWAEASKIYDVGTIPDALEKYDDEIKSFSEQSIVSWHGQDVIKPCGVNMIIRLEQDSVQKQSFSYIKSNYARMLKFAEMELLNLSSRGLYDIINELDIRSINKHYNAFGQIQRMQKTGECDLEFANNLRFFNILRVIGFEFNLCEGINNDDFINPAFEQFILNDKQLELFDE